MASFVLYLLFRNQATLSCNYARPAVRQLILTLLDKGISWLYKISLVHPVDSFSHWLVSPGLRLCAPFYVFICEDYASKTTLRRCRVFACSYCCQILAVHNIKGIFQGLEQKKKGAEPTGKGTRESCSSGTSDTMVLSVWWAEIIGASVESCGQR